MQDIKRRPLVAGNWKMNGELALVAKMEEAISAAGITAADVVVCPPFPYLSAFKAEALSLGAQNLSQFDSGAHTGEISGKMLQEAGCKYVILGHSERRSDNGETNALVAEKVEAALKNGLTPLFCIGESLQEREGGQLESVLSAQIDAVVERIGIQEFAKVVIAYEPVWAIGTGVTATPEQAQDTHAFIRAHLAKQDEAVAAGMVILYGGSVKGANAEELFAQKDIDGGLIGGASLLAEEFVKICQAAK